MTATGLACSSCGIELPRNAKFYLECGASVSATVKTAEYKQVTVLFADVVRSMDIGAAVGSERLREIMAELVDRGAQVVKRYGGTVDKFTGDGIMALFGAPVALEDHALRACRAALEIHSGISDLAQEVSRRDGVELQLRIGLNSGQVITGEIGTAATGYTGVGEQVGMAQRMESVAPPGGVILSASTARLVDGAAVLGEPELVQIKGADEPVLARRLLGMGEGHRALGRDESNLVGRRWEMSAVEGLLDLAVAGQGAVVGVVGPPGIGKSRLVRDVAAMVAARGVEVFSAFCESHTSQVPFHAVSGLLRAATGVDGLDGQAARDLVRNRVPDADPEDVLLLDDLLGIADPEVERSARCDPLNLSRHGDPDVIELLARRGVECGIAALTALFLANHRPVAELAREGHARVVIAEGAAHLYATLGTGTRGHVEGSAERRPAQGQWLLPARSTA